MGNLSDASTVLATDVEQRLVAQHHSEYRPMDQTLDRCWDVATVLPPRELTMLPSRLLDAHRGPGG
jgi:V/A-type H+-transporting ATPase subunit B